MQYVDTVSPMEGRPSLEHKSIDPPNERVSLEDSESYHQGDRDDVPNTETFASVPDASQDLQVVDGILYSEV